MPGYTILQDGGEYDTLKDLPHAVELAEELLGGVMPEQLSTFTVVDEDGALKASVTNRRIIGTFFKQHWRDDNEPVDIGRVEFDATDAILLMTLVDLHALEDRDDSTDAIGGNHVQWAGPFEVEIVESICLYFGVDDLCAITDEALTYARGRANPAPWGESVEVLTVRVRIRRAPGVSVAEAISALLLQAAETRSGFVACGVEIDRPAASAAV